MPSLIPNSMEIWEVSLIPLQGTELLKEGDLECNDFGESNKVMNVPLYRLLKSGKWKVKSEKEKNKWFIVSLFIQ